MRALTTLSLSAALAALVGAAATSRADDVTAPPVGDPARHVAPHGFAGELLRAAAARGGAPNLALAPVSASTTLGLLLAGARGETEAQLRRALGLGDLSLVAAHEAIPERLAGLADLPGVVLGARVFMQEGRPVLPSFADAAGRHRAEVQALDFAGDPAGAAAAIEAWAREATGGRIPSLVDADGLGPRTALVVASSMTFAAPWRTSFAVRKRLEPFGTSAGRAVELPFMEVTAELAVRQLDRAGGLRAVEVPYAGDRLIMTIVVPDRPDGLAALERAMSGELLHALLRAPTAAEVGETHLVLPRFHVRQRLDLADAVRDLGAKALFEGADLSAITGAPLAVSRLVQAVDVTVDERGTAAAAVTQAEVSLGLPREVRVDRPFLFAVHDRTTGEVLVVGRVGDPTS